MGNKYVVEACRGEQSFPGGCRGDEGSMSWVIGMSWRYVVEHRVVVEVCRG